MYKNDDINNKITKCINEIGFSLINVGHDKQELLSFTIGLHITFGIPEFIFVNESPEMASEIVNEVINYQGLGLTIEEILNMITIEGEPLKMETPPNGVMEQLTPQIGEYYRKSNPDNANFELIWVGKGKSKSPFETFLS
jgi:hypothetical protein